MKKIAAVFICCSFLFCLSGTAQTYKYLYYLDGNLSSVDPKEALILGKGNIDSNLVKVDFYNKVSNDKIMTIHFTEPTLTTMSGFFQSFYHNKIIENEGMYKDGVEEGLWVRKDSAGLVTDSTVYLEGLKMTTCKYIYNSGIVSNYEFYDSLSGKSIYRNFNNDGTLKNEADFIGEIGEIKTFDQGKATVTSVTKKVLKDASFEGGMSAWGTYLKRNLNAATPVDNHAPSGTYTVIVKFMVASDGTLSDIIAETNKGYGMEAEVIKMLKNSPKWSPATISGVAVSALRRQPVTFAVEGGY